MSPASPVVSKALVVGLDGAAPEWVFGRWLDQLPTLRSLTERGANGVLGSCDPPMTVPAWSVMTSSRSPGALGVYGFRNRRDHGDDSMAFADSRASCFLTPDVGRNQYAYPAQLPDEVERVVGRYLPDVANFRTEERDCLLEEIEEMTQKRFG
jgi:predicted AlkP superfamily phosphohydrolase/phosphomutase